MRTLRHLFEPIVGFENLVAAWREARKSKRYRRHAAHFELDADLHLLQLARELHTDTYRPGRFRLMLIREPKRRLIAAAPFRDRVVHHAISRVLMPQLSRSFIHDSYACIQGKGTHRAVLRHLEFMRRFRYRCHIDVRAFFPSIHVDVLLGILHGKLRDPRTLCLLRHIIESGLYIYQDARLMSHLGLRAYDPGERCGMPIGNLTSQHLANVYLDGLDHHIKRDLKVRGYIRYMDDMVLFGDDRRALSAAAAGTVSYLRNRLLLHEKEPPRVQLASKPVLFLGHRLDRSGLSLSPRTVAKIRSRARRFNSGSFSADQLTRRIASWRGMLCLCGSDG